MDALDALITAGQARERHAIDDKVAQDLARMLGGRILFHYQDGRYIRLRPQSEHTLSTWTIHRLVHVSRVHSYAVRPRPEFWQPEQRRPRAVLAFPIGMGVAAIARDVGFTQRERRAVRTVLRFLAARRPRGPAKVSDASRPAYTSPPTLAGEGLIGASRPWKAVLRQVAKVAPARCSVVLLGATGTGKERLARAIHSASPRSQGPFVPVNCGAIAPDVMASELFGHIRGAFTGAHRTREGLLVRANRGTLFLDEVVETSPAMQVALLRVLEDRKVLPVGSTRPRTVDIRIVSATNEDLHDAVEAGAFREDLFHRLNVISIRLPPLHERGEDLLLLADHLLSKMDPRRRLHPDAAPVLRRYRWPGNVRELDNVLNAAALLIDGHEITPEILVHVLEGRQARTLDPAPARLGPRPQQILEALGERWLSSSALARRLGVSGRTVNRDLQRLLDLGLIQSHGRARARVYRRAGSA